MFRVALTSSWLLLSGGALAQSLIFTSVRPIGPDGKSPPALGDASYGIRVGFRSASARGPFRVKFEIADKVGYLSVPGGSGSWDYRWLFTMPLDGEIPYAVKLDPDRAPEGSAHAANVVRGTFTPIPPKTPVEYFDPRDLVATETLIARFAPIGDLTDFTTVFGTPTTATSQIVTSLAPPEGAQPVRTLPFGEPAFLTKRSQVSETTTQTLSFGLRASNVRMNAELIRDGWPSLATLPAEIRLYTEPEAEIQSADARIVAYVRANLPADYRASSRPIEAARRLFRAVIRDTVYQYPAPPSALKTLASGKGDCGGFSRLYVACLRAAGIPARTVCGWRKGDDQRHCWSEMYLPSAGWIPQDATQGNACCPDGSYAYDFGTMPDLNARASVSRASTNGIGTARVDGDLQMPRVWHWYVGAVAPGMTIERHTTLNAAPTNGAAPRKAADA